MQKSRITGLAALTLGAMLLPAVWAQDAPPANNPPPSQGMHEHGRMNAEKQLHHMTRALNLNSDQQQQVGQILRDRDQQMMQIHQNAGADPRASRQQMRSAMMDSDAKLRGVLNPQQQQKFDAMRAEMREKHEGMRGGEMGGPGGPPQQGGEAPPPPQQ